MRAVDSRTIRVIITGVIAYLVVRYAIPEQLASPAIQAAVADIIVVVGASLAAWYRKNASVAIDGWFK